MSQRGRSGFLSYLLLLSRVLRFEHRVEEVVGALGLLSRESGAQSRDGVALWPLPTLALFSSRTPAAGVVSLVGLGPLSFVCMEPKAICHPCSWRCCE